MSNESKLKIEEIWENKKMVQHTNCIPEWGCHDEFNFSSRTRQRQFYKAKYRDIHLLKKIFLGTQYVPVTALVPRSTPQVRKNGFCSCIVSLPEL